MKKCSSGLATDSPERPGLEQSGVTLREVWVALGQPDYLTFVSQN